MLEEESKDILNNPGLEKIVEMNFFQKKIQKALYFQVSNFLLQFQNYSYPFFLFLTQACDKLNLPQQIKFLAKKILTLYINANQESDKKNYDSLIVASLTFTVKSFPQISHLEEIIWQSLKAKEQWSHIIESEVQQLQIQIKKNFSISSIFTPYNFARSISQIFDFSEAHQNLLAIIIDLAITLPESCFYNSLTICYSSLYLLFDLQCWDIEQKMNSLSQFEYSKESVENFFKILRNKYHRLIESQLTQQE